MDTKIQSALNFLLYLAFEEGVIMSGEAALCETPSRLFRGACISPKNCGVICEKEGFLHGRCKLLKCICSKDCSAGGGGPGEGPPTEGPPEEGPPGEGPPEEGPPGGEGPPEEGPPGEGPPEEGPPGGEGPPEEGPPGEGPPEGEARLVEDPPRDENTPRMSLLKS